MKIDLEPPIGQIPALRRRDFLITAALLATSCRVRETLDRNQGETAVNDRTENEETFAKPDPEQVQAAKELMSNIPDVIPCRDGEASVRKYPVEGATLVVIVARNIHHIPELMPTGLLTDIERLRRKTKETFQKIIDGRPTEEDLRIKELERQLNSLVAEAVHATDISNADVGTFFVKQLQVKRMGVEGVTTGITQANKDLEKFREGAKLFKELHQLLREMSKSDSERKQFEEDYSTLLEILGEQRSHLAMRGGGFGSVIDIVFTGEEIELVAIETKECNERSETGRDEDIFDGRQKMSLQLATDYNQEEYQPGIMMYWGGNHGSEHKGFPHSVQQYNKHSENGAKKVALVVVTPPGYDEYIERIGALHDEYEDALEARAQKARERILRYLQKRGKKQNN